MKKLLSTKLNRYLFYFLLGFFGFSSFSYYILVEVLQLPFYAIEIFFIPIILIYYKKIIFTLKYRLNKNSLYFSIFLTLFFFSAIIGVVFTNGDFFNILSLLRSPILLFLIISYFNINNNLNISTVEILSLGSVVGSLVYTTFYSNVDLNNMNLIALGLLLIIPIIKRKFFNFLIYLFISLSASFASGFRISLAVIFVVSFVGFIWIIFKKDKNSAASKIQIIISAIILLFTIIFSYGYLLQVVSTILDVNAFAIYRVSERLKNILLFDFVASQDIIRFTKISDLIYEKIFQFYPIGPVGRSILNVGNYIDVPIVFIIDLFGSIIAIILVSYFFRKGFIKFKKSFNKNTHNYDIMNGLMFPTFVLLMLFNGRFLYITYESILAAIIFSSWFKKEI